MVELLMSALKKEVPKRWKFTSKVHPDMTRVIIRGRKYWYKIFPRIIVELVIYNDAYVKMNTIREKGKLEKAFTVDKTQMVIISSPYLDPVEEILKFIWNN